MFASMKKFVPLSTGVRIEYVEHGRADGVPVIFLHGVTDSWRSFERVLPLLPPNIHAFALSQRGHGDSSRPTSGYQFADMSADLLAFLDAMGLRTATVVGHRDTVVRVDGDLDLGGLAGERLVDRVVHHLVDQVVEPTLPCGADVHAGPLANGLESFQDLDFTGIVLVGHGFPEYGKKRRQAGATTAFGQSPIIAVG